MFLCSHSSPPKKNSCNILFNTCVREKMAELFLVLYLDVQEQCSRILECSSSILYHLCFPNDILMQDLKEVSGETARIIRQYSTQPKLRNWLFVEVTQAFTFSGAGVLRGNAVLLPGGLWGQSLTHCAFAECPGRL